jgi:hypothetical protein
MEADQSRRRELRRALSAAAPHLKLAVPAVIALAWLVRRVRGHARRGTPAETASDTDVSHGS